MSFTKEKSLRARERRTGLRTRNKLPMIAVQSVKEQNNEG